MGIREFLGRLFGAGEPEREVRVRPVDVGRNLGREEVAVRVTDGDRPPPPPSSSETYLSEAEAAYYFVPDADGMLPVRIRGGFFQHPGTGRSVPPGNRALSKHGLRSFAARGAGHYPSEVRAADTSPGTRVIYRREPDNPHDPNAVALCGLDRRGKALRVGYVSKGRAKTLAKRMDAGEEPPEAYYMRGSACGVDAPAGVAVVQCDRATIDRLLR